ncbi:unnamed protein product [Ambrosiozyma monospora]|uniref:Unnamed protein product n=1 Tax=Ambrosiozyma monospora TaxID=43982 RepID=A0ACB5U276_AMBMO|nr:unnamed protein product [Ambrosiozyma monospora]
MSAAAATATHTLKLKGEVPLDQEIASLIRSGKAKSSSHQATNYESSIYGPDPEGLKLLPAGTRIRLEESGVDISKGYPERPDINKVPIFLDEAFAIRNEERYSLD